MSKLLLQKFMDTNTPYIPVNEFVAWQARLNSGDHVVNEATKAFNSGCTSTVLKEIPLHCYHSLKPL